MLNMAKSEAEAFKERGRGKEFIDEEGRHFILLQFPDGSGVVLKKEKSDGPLSVAKYIPQEITKDALANITDQDPYRTRSMVKDIIDE